MPTSFHIFGQLYTSGTKTKEEKNLTPLLCFASDSTDVQKGRPSQDDPHFVD